MKRSLGVLSLAVVVGCMPLLADLNGDGIKIIALGGDSNTAETPTTPSWTTFLAAEFPNHWIRKAAWGGTTALDLPGTTWGNPKGAPYYIGLMLAWAWRPDVIVLAWGENDVILGYDPETIADAIDALVDQVESAGIVALVATVPDLQWELAYLNPTIATLNGLLRERYGAECVIDLNAVNDPALYLNAGHFTTEGQQARAAVAATALRAMPASCL